MSPTTASRREAHTGKVAKLDHLITWNIEVEGEGWGRAVWVGHPIHDHARVQYRVAEWAAAATTIEGEMQSWVAKTTIAVKQGQADVGEDCQIMMQQ